jgi:hypothetical protein
MIENRGVLDYECQQCYVVFVRENCGPTWWPETVERPVAACPSYEEAARVRKNLRLAGKTCVIRFVGQTGGGD